MKCPFDPAFDCPYEDLFVSGSFVCEDCNVFRTVI